MGPKRRLIHSNIRTTNTHHFSNDLNSSSVSALGRGEIIFQWVKECQEGKEAGLLGGQLIPG